MNRFVPFLTAIVVALLMSGCDQMSSLTGPDYDKNQHQTRVQGSVSTAATDRESEVIPGQYIVVLNEEVPNVPEAARDLADQAGAQVMHVYRHALKGFSAKMTAQAAEQLSNRSDVAYVEQDRTMHMHAQTLPTGVDRIQADQNSTAAIDNSPTKVDVDIAILDTGIDLDHPDLNVVHDVDCTNESGGPPWQRTASCGTMDSGNGDDGNGHGSHVAGTAAALDNDQGVVGVAPGARLWAVKVLDNNGSGSISMIVAGIDWVTSHADQVDVANMSLGGTGSSSALRTAIQNSVEAGILYTVSASNDASDVYGSDGSLGGGDDYLPAAYPEVATISAMADSDGQAGGAGGSTSYGEDDSFASFSNYSGSVVSENPVSSPGAAIDLLLPGVDIYSTYSGGGYNTLSGTSMSSPHGAGLAALYIAANGRDTDGSGTFDQTDVYNIRQALIDGGIGQGSSDGLAVQNDPDGNTERIGWAEDTAIGNAPAVSWTNPTDGATVSGTVTLQIDGSDTEDDAGTLTVEWGVDGNWGNTASYNNTSGYYEANWNSTDVSEGSHTLQTRATDSDGNTTSSSISVTVDNVNETPSASFTYSCSGLDCTFDATGSSDSDGSITDYAWDFGDGSSTSGSDQATVTHSYSTGGDYDVTLTVTDDDGATDSQTQTVSVSQITDMHVGDLDGNSINNGSTWTAEVTVTVHTQDEQPIEGADVSGSWSTGGTSSGITDANGQVVLSTSLRKKVGETTFTVENVSSGDLTYNSSDNHDPDGDSNGTSITLVKP